MEDVADSQNWQEFADAVGKIEQHVVRAKAVTHRLLGFARRMEPVTERVNVNSVLDDTIEFLKNESRYRNIEIQSNYAPELPLTTSDSSQRQQVFLNIINNAIDAIGKDGKIVIATRFIAENHEAGFSHRGVKVGRMTSPGKEDWLLDERLLQSQKLAASGELSAGIAHEINNPLAIIRQEAEWTRSTISLVTRVRGRTNSLISSSFLSPRCPLTCKLIRPSTS
jgi:C4-dicarboxylate-specific signal transduction histidine kinase